MHTQVDLAVHFVIKVFWANSLRAVSLRGGYYRCAAPTALQNLTAPFAPFIIDRCKGLRRKYLQVPGSGPIGAGSSPWPQISCDRWSSVLFHPPRHCSVQ